MTEIALPKPSPWLLRGRTEVARHRKRFDQLSPRRIVARKIDEWMDGVIKDPNLGIPAVRAALRCWVRVRDAGLEELELAITQDRCLTRLPSPFFHHSVPPAQSASTD